MEQRIRECGDHHAADRRNIHFTADWMVFQNVLTVLDGRA
jgi:hypothetical protein